MAQNVFLKEPSPTKVVVVNENNEPVQVEIPNLPLQDNGSSVYVYVRNGISIQALRPQSSYYNVSLDNILLLQGDGGFFAIPLNSCLTNLTNSNINAMLQSYKTAYATLVSGVTAATLHYSKMSSIGVVTSETFNLKAE